MLKCKGVGQHGLPRILCNLPVYSTLWQVDTKVFWVNKKKTKVFSNILNLIFRCHWCWFETILLHINSKLSLYRFLVVLDIDWQYTLDLTDQECSLVLLMTFWNRNWWLLLLSWKFKCRYTKQYNMTSSDDNI